MGILKVCRKSVILLLSVNNGLPILIALDPHHRRAGAEVDTDQAQDLIISHIDSSVPHNLRSFLLFPVFQDTMRLLLHFPKVKVY